MSFTIVTHSIVIFNLVVLSGLISLQRNNSIPRYLLAGIIFIPAPFFITHLLFALFGYNTLTVQTIFISSSISPLFGPLMYFYVLFMTGKKKRFVLTDLAVVSYSFIPLLFWIRYLLLSSQDKMNYVASVPMATDPEFILFDFLFTGSLFVFVLLSIVEITSFRKKIKEQFSYEVSTRLEWISRLVRVVLWLNLFGALTQGYVWLFQPQYLLTTMNIVLTINVAVFYLFLLQQAFQHHSNVVEVWYDEQDPPKVIQKEDVILKEEAFSTAQLELLVALFEKEKIYLEPNLKLKDLADKSGLPIYVVSSAINSGLGKTFFDFVNEYRVEYACQLLGSDNQDKMETVGYNAGFNSKTAFYRAFKKYKGISPQELVRRQVSGERNQ